MKNIIKIFIDIIMTVLFFILLAYNLTGRTIHEYLGFLIFAFFIVHHILNFNWCKNLFKGKYNLTRTFNTFINVMLFICMLGLIINGILFNKDLVEFFNLSSIKVINKKLHVICSYWGFIFMSAHLGMHWGIFINMSKKFINIKKTICITIALLIAIYGIVSFIKIDLHNVIFLITKLNNYDEPAAFFFMDHIAIMGLFIFITYYLCRLSTKLNKLNQ